MHTCKHCRQTFTTSHYCGVQDRTITNYDTEDFILSALVAYETDNAVLGALAGGDIAGAIVGEVLSDLGSSSDSSW